MGDGQEVKAGQVLLRMDTQVTDADQATVETDLMLRRLQLRRIESEMAGVPFTARPGEQIEVKVATSAVSVEGAWKNLEAEATGMTFDQARRAAKTAWNRSLSKVKVEGGSSLTD